jgi:hypothetical protein
MSKISKSGVRFRDTAWAQSLDAVAAVSRRVLGSVGAMTLIKNGGSNSACGWVPLCALAMRRSAQPKSLTSFSRQLIWSRRLRVSQIYVGHDEIEQGFG